MCKVGLAIPTFFVVFYVILGTFLLLVCYSLSKMKENCYLCVGNKISKRMARPKKQLKAKEPVTIRFKKLANGNQSVYLDIYRNGKREYEFLKMYLIPEVDNASKVANENTMTAVNAIKAQRVMDIANNKAGLQNSNKGRSLLLVDYLKAFKEKKVKESQSIGYSQQVQTLINHVESYNAKAVIDDIDRDFCTKFVEHLQTYRWQKKEDGLKRSLSGATICNQITLLNAVINRLVKEGYMWKNPLKDIDNKPKKPDSNRTYLTVEELKSMINGKCGNESVKGAFLFACFCGLRWSDVCNLKWGNVEDGNRLNIVMVKTRERLNVPLSAEAKKWMPEKGDKTDEDFVFTFPRYLTTVNSVLKVWAKNSGVEKNVSFHVSRHTFATLNLTAGVDLYTTSKLVGHKSIQTTQIYAKIIDAKKVEAVNKVSNLFE